MRLQREQGMIHLGGNGRALGAVFAEAHAREGRHYRLIRLDGCRCRCRCCRRCIACVACFCNILYQ